MFNKNKTRTKVTTIDISNLKELRIFTTDGMYSFTTKGLYEIEGYGKYAKDRLEKIISRIFKGEGVLKLSNGRKIDLTMQVQPPLVIYRNQ